MNNEEEDKDEEIQQKVERKNRIPKEKILDESFKKAELLKKFSKEKKEEQILVKKPIIKLGFIIAIIAIVGLVFINFIPWLYINYQSDFGIVEEYFSFADFKNYRIEPNEINSIFESTCINCSDNSNNYIGLTYNDFINTPTIASYIFIFLLAIGIIFTIFILIDRKKDFYEETVLIVHSIFTAFIIIIGLILILLSFKFFSAHLLLQINKPFIEVLGLNNIKLFYFMPYVLFIFSISLFIIGLTFIRINLNKAVNKLELDKSKELDFNYRFGSKI